MRSTSGMTCCHFFCSAVFSIPVWRKPIVGSAEVSDSPSSSSTSRSTPCVLGCCGPMLTVIVSLRSSGMSVTSRPLPVASLDDFAHDVQQGAMHLLHARRTLVGHVHVNLGRASRFPAAASGQGNRLQPR